MTKNQALALKPGDEIVYVGTRHYFYTDGQITKVKKFINYKTFFTVLTEDDKPLYPFEIERYKA